MRSGSRAAYALAAVLRVALVFAPSYIHPDEAFQSPEVMAGWLLGKGVRVPWEFSDCVHPARSIALPWVISGLPFALVDVLGWGTSPWVLRLAPRAWQVLLSFLVDAALVRICQRLHWDARPVLLTYATSWTTLVFASHTFSNWAEAACVVLFLDLVVLWLVQADRADPAPWIPVLWGVVLAVGIFVRFTFPCFVAPLGVAVFVHLWGSPPRSPGGAASPTPPPPVTDVTLTPDSSSSLRRRGHPAHSAHTASEATTSSTDNASSTAPPGSTPTFWVRLARLGILVGLPFVATASLLALLDSLAFRGPSQPLRLVIAPWNNLVYNLDPANTATHGVHPRLTHAGPNFVFFFGPLALLAYAALPRLASRALTITDWCLWMVVSGITFLSLSNHQEARFLLPLAAPLALVFGPRLFPADGSSRPLRVAWLGLQLALVVVMGVLHQGALASTVSSLAPVQPNSTVVFHETYMVPRHWFAFEDDASHRPSSDPSAPCADNVFHDTAIALDAPIPGVTVTRSQEGVRIVDTVGSDHRALRAFLALEVDGCDAPTTLTALLIVPGTVLEAVEHLLGIDGWEFRRVASHGPHLAMENLPSVASDLALSDQLALHVLSLARRCQ